MNNAAITLAYFDDQPARVVFGPETPVNEQLDAAQDWAGTERVPFPGTTHIEVWAPHGNAVRARFNFPAGAPQVEGFEGDLTVAELEQVASKLATIAELEEKLTAALATIDSQKAEIAHLHQEAAKMAFPPPAEKAPDEDLPTVTVPPTGGPATPAPTPSSKSKGK